MSPATELPPVTAEIDVPVQPEVAFDLYVHRPGRTHPSEGQSGNPVQIVYEPFEGGRWYEVGADGREHDWGRVVVWDPPHRLVLAWMVNADANGWHFDPDPDHASRAELTFEGTPAGTRVRVLHTEYDRHGAGGVSIRRGTASGWTEDLNDLRAAALRSAAAQARRG